MQVISDERKQVRKMVRAVARLGSPTKKKGQRSWDKARATPKLPEVLKQFQWSATHRPTRKPPGRPKGVNLQKVLADELEHAKDKTGVPIGTLLMRSLICHALGGNVLAMKEILDRVDGKVAQPIAVSADITVRPINYAMAQAFPIDEQVGGQVESEGEGEQASENEAVETGAGEGGTPQNPEPLDDLVWQT